MAKVVTAAGVPADRGNILAANYLSWQNNSAQYYTRTAEKQGFGTGFLYDVRSFDSLGNPRWGQPHKRKSTLTGSFLYPQPDSLIAPPIDTL